MSKTIPVSKDQNNQTSIPTVWRSTLSAIVEAFKDGDYRIARNLVGVPSVSEEDAKQIKNNIVRYGATLTNLPDESWDTSVCQWMDGYWDVLVDLYTIEEGASDLALVVRVFEDPHSYVYEVQSVHVP
ncbi:hypothetical protein RE428_24520 [Marinobacter nanhaiticus D15-8W]|uniref:DUF7668 domain-containing protein n=1 Tax=Marinobacter nanhaiticus TaxID=1305740 RepID=UPI0012B635E6|nr:hypothetical protein [Marinobacter nanhaiticus]BES71434.1 hypothetical protein RE428_24520 [Marinobacter nanhaiticus D15-8W]